MLLPNKILHKIYDPFLRRIPHAQKWADAIAEVSARGAVIHIVRNVSLLDLLALKHLSARFGLPDIGFANDFEEALGAASSAKKGSGNGATTNDPAARLREAVLSGKSAVLFLKRVPSVIERASSVHRGKTEGDALLNELIEIVRTTKKEVFLVPETLVWTLRPERVGFSLYDFFFSPAEFPGEVRALAQLFANHEHVVVRAGQPLLLREMIRDFEPGAPLHEGDSQKLIRRLVYALLRRASRERKSVVGPAQKPPDRVREEVLKSPKLGAVLRGGQRDIEKARKMLRGLQAEPDPSTLRILESLADTVAERVFSGIDVDLEGIERVREAARRGSVVLLPSHKSHVDYLLLHYVLRKHSLNVPLVAAGDNLSFFPIGPLLRRSGAFFIKRSFRGEKLYTVVVEAYIRRLLRDGHAIELFIEGGRSRTGKLLPPQVGLLNMVVEATFGLEGRPVSFVPVSIGYERMMEETEFLRELSGEAKKGEDVRSLITAGQALLGSYGRPNVQFGRVIDIGEMRRKMGIAEDPSPAKRRSLVNALAEHVMDEINRVTAVTPGALVATVLLCHPRRGMPHAELLQSARRLLRLVQTMGARVTPKLILGAGTLSEPAIRAAAEVYVRGGLLRCHVPGDTLTGVRKHTSLRSNQAEDVIWVVPEERRIALDIPKNMIVHLFVERAFIAIAMGASLDADIQSRAKTLARLFRFELNLRADNVFDARYQTTLTKMIESGEVIALENGGLAPGIGHDGLDGRGWLLFYASVLRNFLEGYRVLGRALRTLGEGPVEKKEFVLRSLRIGEQMFLGGEIERAEAISRPIIENALLAFRELGYLKREGDKVALADAYSDDVHAHTTSASPQCDARASEASPQCDARASEAAPQCDARASEASPQCDARAAENMIAPFLLRASYDKGL